MEAREARAGNTDCTQYRGHQKRHYSLILIATCGDIILSDDNYAFFTQ